MIFSNENLRDVMLSQVEVRMFRCLRQRGDLGSFGGSLRGFPPRLWASLALMVLIVRSLYAESYKKSCL